MSDIRPYDLTHRECGGNVVLIYKGKAIYRECAKCGKKSA